MRDRTPPLPPVTDDAAAARLQILATEHWSLLATRALVYNEVFSRAGIFLTVVSAAVVALALAAQATEFGDGFYAFAFLVLPMVLIVGVGTYLRTSDANSENVWLVVGMNRLRHAYLEVAPELERYFVTSRYDDEKGLMETFGPEASLRATRVIASTPMLVGLVNAFVAGVLAGLIVEGSGGERIAGVVVGAIVTLAMIALLVAASRRELARLRRALAPPRFPRPPAE
jgi:hypothetical protein